MQLKDAIGQLKKMGTAQNVKIYKRHGAGDNLYGVSFANLNILKKKIKIDHGLAEKLWATGNVDAQTLATMIADPTALKASVVDAWMRDVKYYLLADLLASLVARSDLAEKKMAQWMKSKKEPVRQCGYALLACRLRDGHECPSCRDYLATIEREIHSSPNRARHAMNMALVAIGVYCPDLTEEALATAARIGKVAVDHGETSCKTPDAADYIRKTVARNKSKRAKAKSS